MGNLNQGKNRRIKRIFQQDNRAIIVPMDHGVTVGPIQGITNMQQTINQLVKGGVDAVLIHKGIVKTVDTIDTGLIVMLNGMSNLNPNMNNKTQVCSVKEATRIGADAVAVHVNIGAQDEDKMLSTLGKVAEECESFGLPLLAMMYPRGPKITNEHAPEAVAHAARIGAELGADIIKTNYTGTIESFKQITESCPVPVLIAGGPKCKNTEDLLQTTSDALKAGASGLSMGRNVFQWDNQALITKALSTIVHKGASVEQAKKILGEKT
ncbi:MAG: 2-amino-3,7-dideoxy-D-threo-hept-6-ulosonate synthase [Nitrososphaerota archaeon]|jgi:fructose-bisphosphate aldolase/2-amino-3,7-dideoxy-D-threo-hept-6-ulosonate synthase|nr:2-amino-3,7-dideoxy-D-threo-hept-6-ulosonate synthase [Nitrososphaerota archaeon]